MGDNNNDYDDKKEAEWVSPNVIIILVDDLGVADVSFSARRLHSDDPTFQPAIRTPELDELAEHSSSGIQLTNAFTHMICGPSRAALVTGRLAHKLGNPFPMIQGGSLDPKYKTIGHEFQLRGYSTHFVGKWGIDYPRPSAEVLNNPEPTYETFNGWTPGMGPTERGFDTFYGLYSSGHNHYTKEVFNKGMVDWHKHNETHKLDYPDIDHHPTEYSTDIFSKEAIEVIQSWSPDKPGFLHLSYTAPHDPLQAPDDDINGETCGHIKNWRRKTFCGMVAAIDRGVGDIKHALQTSSKYPNLIDNTIILFSTDNGGAPPVGGYNYPYRGQKATLYEGGFRTPAFIYVPSGDSESTLDLLQIRNNHYPNTVHIVDFGPTLLGLVDRISGNDDRVGQFDALGDDIDGVDHTEFMLKSLREKHFFAGEEGGELPAPPRNETVLEHHAFMEHAAYLEGEWKLILGAAGQSDRFFEPKGRWYDDNGRPRWVIEETAADFIDRGLGINWFVYGWAMRFMVGIGMNTISSSPTSASARGIMRNRTRRMLSHVINEPYGATVSMVENETLPPIEFDNFAPTEIQLYNVKEDPFEDHNVAYENQELVRELYQNLQQKIQHDPGHHFSVQKFFMLNPMRNLAAFMLLCGLLGLVASAFVFFKFCSKKKKNADKKTKKE